MPNVCPVTLHSAHCCQEVHSQLPHIKHAEKACTTPTQSWTK